MSLIVKWRGIEYLNQTEFSLAAPGRAAELYNKIQELELFSLLRVYMPTLVGSYAVGLDILDESVEILCETYSLDSFKTACEEKFAGFSRFQVVEKTVGGDPVIVARFKSGNFFFEITAAPKPIEDQNLFLTTASIDRILKLAVDPGHTKRTLVQVRQQLGLGLEEAVCRYFRLALDANQPVLTGRRTLMALLETEEIALKQRLVDTEDFQEALQAAQESAKGESASESSSPDESAALRLGGVS